MAPKRGPQLLTSRPLSTYRANIPRPTQKHTVRRSPPPSSPRVRRLRLPRLLYLTLKHLLRHLQVLRIRIGSPRVDRIESHIQDVPTAEAA